MSKAERGWCMAKKQIKPDEKKRQSRSPNYPSISLPQAIERVRGFYREDGKAGARLEVAIKHIGFASLHGIARSQLSALKKYALIDIDENRVRPSNITVDIFEFPASHPRRARAVREAALSPAVFKYLVDKHRGSGNL